MLSAEAHVETARPSRYLVQLCRHFNHKGQHLRHRPRSHHGADAPTHREMQAQQMHVEWSETRGTVNFGWGQCTMQATPGTLTLHAEATGEDNLQRVQDLVTGHLDRFSRRDHLTVTWQQPQAPTAQPSDTTSTTPATEGRAVPRRRHLRTIGLTTAGALAIAVHLGLGGAILANLRWTGWAGWAADLVLAVILLKVTALGVLAIRRSRVSQRNGDDQRLANWR